MPVSPSSSNPSGMLTVLKNGGRPIFEPRTASLMIGNSVPRAPNAIPTSTTLL